MITSNFTDMRRYPYRLHAAFFHRGTQGYGHYWVYIYDFKQELWRKYNDGYVTRVENTNEIFARPPDSEFKTYSGPANPYLLIYIKDGEQDKLAESVHRDIVYPAPAEPPPQKSQMMELPPASMDVEMNNQAIVNGEHGKRPLSSPAYAPLFKPLQKVGNWDDSKSQEQRKW